jgi:hypothetical protein
MHVLIGLTIIVGLIAIGFGGGTARAFVRGIIYCTAAVVFVGAAWFAIVVWEEMQPMSRSADSRRAPSACGDCVNPPPWLAKSAVADSYFPAEPRCGYACEETAHSGKDVRRAAK